MDTTNYEKESYQALCQIAKIYEDYHYTSDTVLEKIGDILRLYEFID